MLVDRDGTVHQGAPFNKRVSHAGYSNWQGQDYLNGFSIGICAANFGYFDLKEGAYYFRSDIDDLVFHKDEVHVGRHYSSSQELAWETYPDAQMNSIQEVCKTLKAKYPSIENVVGHDDVAIGRKLDPGPAFDYTELRKLFPLTAAIANLSRYKVSSPDGLLNLRSGPSGRFGKIDTLKNGDVVYLRSRKYIRVDGKWETGPWASVSLSKKLTHSGFLHTGYITPA